MKKETIIRTAVLLVAFINQILACFSLSPLPIEDETLTQILSTILTMGAGVWAWWKNNSFTRAAQEADNYLAVLKEQDAQDAETYDDDLGGGGEA